MATMTVFSPVSFLEDRGFPMRRLDDESVKRLYKEALKEWLDDRFSVVGKWTARALFAALFSGIVYFLLWLNGWHK